MDNPETWKAYQDYWQVHPDARLGEWFSLQGGHRDLGLMDWNECWVDENLSECAWRVRHMLDAWSCAPGKWGPPLTRLKLPITISNKDGLGVRQVPQCLLSSILPRFGHKSTTDEITYMSAEAADADQRYYCATVTLFWMLTMVFVRIILLATARYDSNIVLVATLSGLGMWLQFARGAFDLDLTAMVRGRVLKGWIVQLAWRQLFLFIHHCSV